MNLPIILASSSPGRLRLLKQIGIIPHKIMPADIDETELKREKPDQLAARLSYQKAHTIALKVEQAIIIAADTVSSVRGVILPKAKDADDVRKCLGLLSNKRHRVFTGVCIIKKDNDLIEVRHKIVKSIIKFKKLTSEDIEFYCNLGEGVDKAGGYTVSGFGESFVTYISGSFSNIIGLPLYETINMLKSLGIRKFE